MMVRDRYPSKVAAYGGEEPLRITCQLCGFPAWQGDGPIRADLDDPAMRAMLTHQFECGPRSVYGPGIACDWTIIGGETRAVSEAEWIMAALRWGRANR